MRSLRRVARASRKLLDIMDVEMRVTMAMTGSTDVGKLGPDILAR